MEQRKLSTPRTEDRGFTGNPEAPQSITFDNGKEFAQHQKIATALNTDVFFAKPYQFMGARNQ